MARQTEWLTIEWLTFFFSYFSVFHFLKIVNIVKIAAKILFLARCKFMITLLRLLKLKENFSHTHTHTQKSSELFNSEPFNLVQIILTQFTRHVLR